MATTDTAQSDPRYQRWRDFVITKDPVVLEEILDDAVIFRSPFFWNPKEGKEAAIAILTTVAGIFENFTYQRLWLQGDDWVLEFSADVQDKSLKGVDMIHWNDQGKISEFEVMIRPANALQVLGMEMGQRLAAAGLF